MGMDLYKSSAVARGVWDRADKYLVNWLGVSLLDIVRENPVSKTVSFRGKNGSRIRSNYIAMQYEVIEQTGKSAWLPLFPEITETTMSYTFQHPQGLLSATQFTQPAMAINAVATFEHMKAQGIVLSDVMFAGHSLGEYCALCSVAEILTVEGIIDMNFTRGMTMQVSIPRDEFGRSQYGMVAISPMRASPTMGEVGLRIVVRGIRRRTKGLLEIINYNVENFQYIVAGELVQLDALRRILDRIKALNFNFMELVKVKSVGEIEALIEDFVGAMVDEAIAANDKSGGMLTQQRGIASIPLTGVDVPFHSSSLKRHVIPFRRVLKEKLDMRYIDINRLIGKYVPNLTGRPFSIDRVYFEYVHSITDSRVLRNIIDFWEYSNPADPEVQRKRGYDLLIELLVYQLASPVRWIETQDLLFVQEKVERLIEIGPGPILSGMASRTISMKYSRRDDATSIKRSLLCTSKNYRDIFYDGDLNVEKPAIDQTKSISLASAPVAAPVAVAAPVVVAAPAPVAAAATGPVADVPVPAKDVLFVLIAHKLKKPIAEIAPTKTIKDLVGGKSTLQNEILGDLGAEFGNVLAEKSEELPLGEVATALQASHSGSLGKTSGTLVNKLVSGKMPGGFGMGQVKAHLSAVHGLGPKRTDAALLHGLLHEPAARLGSEAEAKAWLDKVASSYAASA
eukprot:jgi/Hompol1/2703/HPOL_006136-RA